MRGPLPKTPHKACGATLVRRVPRPPAGLGASGREEWRRAAAELGPQGRNVLTEAAVGLLEDLARAADDAEQFRKVWQKDGVTVSGQGREFAHPMIVAEREARKAINQLRRELGLTPSSVSRVPAGPETPKPGEGVPDEFD